MKPVDENGQQEFPAKQVSFQLEEDERYLKRKRLFIIIGVVTILLAILIIVLCVCLSGKSKEEKKNRFF